MEELVHKIQARLINSFINEAPSTEDLRNFVIISVLFSEGDLLHDEVTKDSFVKLCTMC